MKKLILGLSASILCALAPIYVFAGPYEDGIAADSERNYAVSFPAFQNAVASGHVKAHLKLANHYRYGKGVPKSRTKAIEIYEKAASLGALSAYSEIGYMYAEGEGVTKSQSEALKWYRKAADGGDYMGQYKLGSAYRDGKGVEKSLPMAAYWFELGAAQGHMMSQGNRDHMRTQGVTPWQPPNIAAKPDPVIDLVERSRLYDWGYLYLMEGNYAKAVSYFREAGQAGHYLAQFYLGRLYLEGKGVEKSQALALSWLEKSAAQGTTEAKQQLAELNKGTGIIIGGQPNAASIARAARTSSSPSVTSSQPKVITSTGPVSLSAAQLRDKAAGNAAYDTNDFDKAFRLLLPFAQAGDAKSQSRVGYMYGQGKGVSKSLETSFEWTLMSAKQGYAKAQNNTAIDHLRGKGTRANYTQALYWVKKSEAQGYVSAQATLADMYYEGKGVTRSLSKSIEWTRKAAVSNDVVSQYNLGKLYLDGEGVTKSAAQASHWFEKAAQQGDRISQYGLGVLYAAGSGVSQSDNLAGHWFKKAAEQGHMRAQYNLGVFYERGRGVSQSHPEAVRWYEKSAAQGYKEAQFNLGIAYLNGNGIAKSSSKAFDWLNKSADQGFELAQFEMGQFYEFGDGGVFKNIPTALVWYRKAAAQGNDGARQSVEFYADLKAQYLRDNPRVNSVGGLISEEWIAKMRAEQERCRRPIGMSAYLSDRNQRAGSNSGVRYVYKKPFGCK